MIVPLESARRARVNVKAICTTEALDSLFLASKIGVKVLFWNNYFTPVLWQPPQHKDVILKLRPVKNMV